MTRFIAACICALVCLFSTPGAEARQRHKTYAAHPDCNVTMPCEGVAPSVRGERIAKRLGFGAAQKVYTPRVSRSESRPRANPQGKLAGSNGRAEEINPPANNVKHLGVKTASKEITPSYGPAVLAGAVQRVAAAIVAHPTGCPRSAFCGCGAAVRIFGAPIRSLWLAANWFKFPRTAPAPGTVAVRKHHVFVLEADLGGGVWQVYDANSGRHQTRIHARSIAGYAIVNPRGGAA